MKDPEDLEQKYQKDLDKAFFVYMPAALVTIVIVILVLLAAVYWWTGGM